MRMPFVVFVGASAGGLEAVRQLLAEMPKLAGPPLVVVQHIAPQARTDLAMVYGESFHGKVLEATDKMMLEPGRAYFAPPGYHLLVEGDLGLALSTDDPVHFSRPSIDVLFESAAVLGSRAVGVLLTGANQDGAAGLKAISEAGGTTMVQDPATAVASAMPLAALELFTPDFVGTVAEIGQRICDLTHGEES